MLRILITLLFSLVVLSCKEDYSHSTASHDSAMKAVDRRDSSTISMAQELQEHYRLLDPQKTYYKNGDRARMFLEEGSKKSDINQRLQFTLRAAYELVNAGKNKEAIVIYDKLYEELKQLSGIGIEEFIFRILGMRAVAYFRIGEVENCLENHNSASCILPFQAESYHQLRSGSENAIKNIEELLKIKQDPNFVYLLNVAYMTLGEYPHGVPANYKLPLVNQEQEMGLGRFSNISHLVGVDDNHLSGGVLIDDFTGDGLMDIIASSWSLQDDLVFYVNKGDGSFVESHLQAGLKGITGGLQLTKADYNNDGHMDVLVLRGAWLKEGKHPNSLLKNNGDGSFIDVTRSSGIYSLYPTQTAAWTDFNNDGFLDLYIGNESFKGLKENPGELFLNQKDGTFINIAEQVNADISAFIKGVATADIDNDGDQDLFLSILNKENILLRNDKADTDFGFSFTNISSEAGIIYPLQSFPTWFFDYNNDGFDDLFVGSYSTELYNNLAAEYLKELMGKQSSAESPKLYKNNGDGTFQDVTNSVGLNKVCFIMGCTFGDLNNDGFLDFYLGTGEPDLKAVIPNRAFLNIEGKRFEEITTQAGLGHVQKGHGIAMADLDNDGDQDIYAVMGGAYEGDIFYNALFENPGNENNFIKLKLEGTKSNKSAVGARVKLELMSGRKIYRTVGSVSSFGSSPQLLEIGIGQEMAIKELTVTWPSGEKQSYKKLLASKSYKLVEGTNEWEEQVVESGKFKKSHSGHHHH